MAEGQAKLAEVQALRAFAALVVVAHHAAGRAGLHFGVGAAGVDIFFVISGFIMWTMAMQRPTTPVRFAWNRVARIVPLYWLVTLGMVSLAVLAPSVMPNLQPTPERVAQSLLFLPHRDAAGDIFPVLVPGWTLTYEMFFYALFAVALPLPQRTRLAALSTTMAALVVAGILLAPESAMAQTYTSPLLLEFLAGIWLAHLRLRQRLPGRTAGWVLLAFGVSAYAWLEVTRTYSEAWRTAIWGGPALLVVAGALAAASTPRCGPVGTPRRAPLRAIFAGQVKALGDASYSIYLLHPLVIGLAWRLWGWLPTPGFVLLSLVASALVGIACFALLEKPLTELLKPRPGRAGALVQQA